MKRPLLIASIACCAVIGCGDAEAQDPVVVSTPCAEAAEGAWQTSPFSPSTGCEWFEYRGDTSYRIEHGLGRAPVSLETYVAFAEDGRGSAVASGDIAVIVEVGETSVVLRNRTRETFFARVVLR